MLSLFSKKAFTLIEFLIALVIIGFIVAILVGVFSSPLKQAKTDSSISQVKDSLRQLSEALAVADTQNTIDVPGGSWDISDLVTAGHVTAIPAPPAGIFTSGNETSPYTWFDDAIGGCGANNAGTGKKQITVALEFVTDDFCKAYNFAQGLPNEIVGNCDGGTNCTDSGGSNINEPEPVAATTFCYLGGAGNRVLFNTGFSDGLCP